MSKSYPDKKISQKVRKVLEKNNFTFVRCTGHAIFYHSPTGKTLPISLSKQNGKGGFFTGDKFRINLIKKFIKEKNQIFIE